MADVFSSEWLAQWAEPINSN
ncbi:hypothetical protein LCGC14_2705970, partial [marine sediment metagenome]